MRKTGERKTISEWIEHRVACECCAAIFRNKQRAYVFTKIPQGEGVTFTEEQVCGPLCKACAKYIAKKMGIPLLGESPEQNGANH